MLSRNRLYVVLGLSATALIGGAAQAQAQQPPAPPAAPAPAPAAAPAAVDSNALWAGDWDFTIQLRDSTIGGGWRINYIAGHFTGIVARPGLPPSPVRSFTLRGTKDMTLAVDWNGELYTFTGHLENPRNISGTVSAHGGIGRLRATKRG